MSDKKDWADMDRAVVESESKYESIMTLLASHPEGLSTHRITERLNEAGVVVKSTGQTLHRLRTLERRGRVIKVDGEKGALWKATS